jgi:CheY-like chemotaxis protein
LLGSTACENGNGVTDAWIATCLSKPFTPSDLIEAIAITLQFSTFEIRKNWESSHSIELPNVQPLTILLAEDNSFNQVVALEMLEKAGHRVTLAANGREALAAAEKQAFDLVMMDVQMPEMDGLETTAAIRAREQTTGQHVPIIAMTAHAMMCDQEACSRAGMDGYLSKPVNMQQIHTEIARVLSVAAHAGVSHFGAPAESGAPKQSLEVQPAQERRDRRRQRMLDLFRVEGPRMLAELRAAVTSADATRVAKAAHKLAGAVSYLNAPEAEQAARNMESVARAGNVADAATLDQLEKSLFRFDPALTAACGVALS